MSSSSTTSKHSSGTLNRATLRRILNREVGREGTTLLHILQLTVFFLVVLIVSAGVVLIDWAPGSTTLTPGEIAQQTYKAPRDATYVSELRTEDLRREAFNSVSNVVQMHDETVRTTELAELDDFVKHAAEVRESNQSESEKVASLQAALAGLSQTDALAILAVSDSSWESIADESERLVGQTLDQELQGDQVEAVVEELPERVSSLLTTTQQQLAVGIASEFISPNVFIDDAATQAKRQSAASAVEPVIVTVKAGQAIVRDGDEITARHIEALESLGLLRSQKDISTRLGMAALAAILTLALTLYLYLFNQDIWRQRQLVLVGLVMLTPIVAARVLLPHPDIQYMLPVAASAMLLAVLINIQFASIIAALLAFFVAVVAGLSFELAIMYFLGGIAGASVIWRAERTMTFIWAGAAAALASFSVGLGFATVNENISWVTAGRIFLETGLAGALAASVTFLSFSVLGSVFGITTSLQLQELAHPRQPLLNRLAREAPGTYHHSIIVSNLAEAAIARVGGDPLFARVSVLYHDIGKMKHPTFFIENQANLGNIHDELDPRVSAQIIIDHVRDGIAMARKARLPKPIIDIIAEHHGTTRVEYFFRKAAEADPDVDPAEFTYPGPRPQSREAAVIMLADSVEAAVRSMAQTGKLFDRKSAEDRASESDRLASFVHSIVQARIDAGQMNDSDLTFRDISEIEEAFIQILEGIYHPRVEYPASVDPERTSGIPEPAPSASD